MPRVVYVYFVAVGHLGVSRDHLYGFADGARATLVLRLLAERTPQGADGIRYSLGMDRDRGVVTVGWVRRDGTVPG
jgi:hypothetical protein